MRLFWGLPLGDDTRNAIIKTISALNEEYPDRYTRRDNLHITLTFLGEVEPKLSHMLSNIGDLAFNDRERFVIKTGDIASFKDGRITYLGIEKSPILEDIHNSLNTLLDDAGMVYTDTDVYTPHITLRRGKRAVLDRPMPRMDILVDRICLFESKRVDDILRYIPIMTWELK